MAETHSLRSEVCRVYSGIAESPDGQHPIPTGRALAQGVGYPVDVLDSIPSVAVEAFAGVSYMWDFTTYPVGDVLLDLGCGAGLDSILGARQWSRTIGVDFSRSMLERARRAAAQVGAQNLDFVVGDAEAIPLGRNTVDAAVVNGIFNLNPARAQVFAELARVIRPGGTAFVAEIVRNEEVLGPAGTEDWFS